MLRIEIIGDATLEEEVRKGLGRIRKGLGHSSIYPVSGQGVKGGRFGANVWPEENTLFLMYLPEEDLEKVQLLISTIRSQYPHNGLAAFVLPGAQEI